MAVLAGGVAASLCGCTFDASQLPTKTACLVDGDCAAGRICVEGQCADSAPSPQDDPIDPEPEDVVVDAGDPDAADEGVDEEAGADLPPDAPIGEDTDGDGVEDASDNCPEVFNPAQEDFDRNGTGELCQRPQRSSLVITELRREPIFGQDTERPWAGQLVEIHNRGAERVSLRGFSVSSGSSSLEILEAVEVEPGGFAVIAGVAGPGVDLVTGPALILETTQVGAVRLTRQVEGQEILYDSVIWDESWPWLRGSSLELRQIQIEPQDNDRPTAWCPSGSAPEAGEDGGTPGGPHAGCALYPLPSCAQSAEVASGATIWGTTSAPSEGSALYHFACDADSEPFDGQYSPEVAFRVVLDRPSRLVAALHTEPRFPGLLYLRSGCDLFRFSQQILCGSPAAGGRAIDADIFQAGTYYLIVDGDDDGRPSRSTSGVFTLSVTLEDL